MNYQSRSGKVGAQFEDLCKEIVGDTLGWTVADPDDGLHRFDQIGVWADFVATHPNGCTVVFECKGGDARGSQPGLTRSDNVRKVCADAWALSMMPPQDRFFDAYVVLTTAHVEPDSLPGRRLQQAVDHGAVTRVVNIHTPGEARTELEALALGWEAGTLWAI